MARGGLILYVTGLSRFSCFLGSVSLIVGLLLSLLSAPARAAGSDDSVASLQDPNPTDVPACTPPDKWDQTVRAKDGGVVSWNVGVKEDGSTLRLKFFWFQDYDKQGCPYDCNTGGCQDHETGTIEALGESYEVTDPGLGPNEDSVTFKFEGMHAGTYVVTFTHNGNGHSINIGLESDSWAEPTDTPPPPPTDSPTETSTPTQTILPPTETNMPSATSTFTPTATGTQPTATATETHLPPVSTSTVRPTHQPPTPTATRPTPTATGSPEPTNKPPLPTTTASPTPRTPVHTRTASPTPDSPVRTRTPAPTASPTPPATLVPPTPPPGTALPAALIPVTGADLSQGTPNLYSRLLLHLGIGLLGLGLVGHGIKTRLNIQRESRT